MHHDQPVWTPPPADQRQQPRQTRRILRLFRPYGGRLAVVGVLVCASSLVSVVTPFLLLALCWSFAPAAVEKAPPSP